MILESGILSIIPGQEAAFEAVLPQAKAVTTASQGCQGIEVRRCIERPSHYLLLVHWDTVDDHMIAFRGSNLFAQWRALIGPFFAAPPAVEHFEGSVV
jgi:heme-degrading monooxygenase HmoA